MMNKKRSKNIGRAKCFFFMPLAGALMLLNNIEATARMANTFAERMPLSIKKPFLPVFK